MNMKTKPQLLIIHGGMTFKSKKDYLHFLQTRDISIEPKVRWTDDFLQTHLGDQVDIIRPRMPQVENAKYSEWKIHFERHIPLLHDNIILIGVSLGGIFLAKYSAENTLPIQILSTYLVCPPYDNSLPEEDLVGGFRLPADLSLLEKNAQNLYLLFSKDDPIVPPSQAQKYAKKLQCAKHTIYESKNGHFQIAEFPEIVQMIQHDLQHSLPA